MDRDAHIAKAEEALATARAWAANVPEKANALTYLAQVHLDAAAFLEEI